MYHHYPCSQCKAHARFHQSPSGGGLVESTDLSCRPFPLNVLPLLDLGAQGAGFPPPCFFASSGKGFLFFLVPGKRLGGREDGVSHYANELGIGRGKEGMSEGEDEKEKTRKRQTKGKDEEEE